MEIFDAHKRILDHYESYIKSFINISDDRIREKVLNELNSKKLWPDPLIQFNPGYEKGTSFSELCKEGILHNDISFMFGFTPHKHQELAFRKGVSRESFVVTSGTGSGKSLTYLVPIFDFVLKSPEQASSGVKALLVYPMNALINSQYQEIEKYVRKFKNVTGRVFPLSFEKYTGQESESKKQEIIDNCPDIILTNYMMLELLLIRPKERKLKTSILANLEFLVFDELHSYRGRQGADVAMLIRRMRSLVNSDRLTCIGTSATLATDTVEEATSNQIAKSASAIFGITLKASDVIEESLITNFPGQNPSREQLREYLNGELQISESPELLTNSPLANWLEQNIALERRDSKWARNRPFTLEEICRVLSQYTELEQEICERGIRRLFEQIKSVNSSLSDQDETCLFLPFKLHQFIKQTGLVYLTFESPSVRSITLDPDPFVIKDDGTRLPLFPIVFSRFTGVEFYRVRIDEENSKLTPWTEEFRSTHDTSEQSSNHGYGYVVLSPEEGEDYWNGKDDYEKLPSGWFKKTSRFGIKPDKKYADRMPIRVFVASDGTFSETPTDGFLQGWLMKEKLLFDVTSIMIYPPRASDNTKLAKLGNEGRSTATTILTTGILKALRDLDQDPKVRKVLSFIDNRQDAALQSGHFNDFIRIALLRAAICSAMNDHQELDFTSISQSVFEKLDLPQEEYAEQHVTGRLSEANERAFKTLLFYEIVNDLRKSWRFILPNLEQSGLLRIRYKDFEEQVDSISNGISKLSDLPSPKREELFFQLLEYIRSQFGIHSSEYERNTLESNSRLFREKLNDKWRYADEEKIEEPNWMTVDKTSRRNIFTESLHANSAWGKYLKYEIEQSGQTLTRDDVHDLIYEMLDKLSKFGYLRKKDDADVPMYRINIDVILWTRGDGSMTRDKVRIRTHSSVVEPEPNEFFRKFYSQEPARLRNTNSGEHTGQLKNELRQFNESAFRHDSEVPEYKRLSALYCSPTMELGIDISELVAVHMRNVPPNAANYIQRSGRAGRSGQGALVFTYCGQFNPHDRHYFSHRTQMVAGNVKPLYLDFKNEELWRTHFHSIILGILGINELQTSIGDVIEFEDPDLPIRDSVKAQIDRIASDQGFQSNAKAVLHSIMNNASHFDELSETYWFNDSWIDDILREFKDSFNRAFERWREMYRKASSAKHEATRIIESPVIDHNSREWRAARAEQQRAQILLDMLRNQSTGNREESEFFPYRYLAAEGFIPGYNFTRLPLRAILTDRRSKTQVISRPRSLALTEFGPENIVYYNGSKYGIWKMDLKRRFDQDGQNEFGMERMKIYSESGYVLVNDEVTRNNSPLPVFGQQSIESQLVTNFLSMENMYAKAEERIGCDEEERMRRGYEKDVFFHHVEISEVSRNVVRVIKDDFNYLNLRYLPAVDLIFVAYHWKASAAQRNNGGFAIDTRNGEWLSEKEVNSRVEENRSDFKRVHIYTKDTADALYIEPLPHLKLNHAGAVTLMFALKRAVVEYFQLEQSEIGVQFMGKSSVPNLFIYEAAEGSLGILSQIARKPDVFQQIACKAYEICSFKDGEDIHPKGDKHKASYDDLLDYYNQMYHAEIDRFEVKSALELLISSTYDIQKQRSQEEQYQYLRSRYDESSGMEKQLIDFLKNGSLRLPDEAQKQMSPSGCFASADFFCYPNICIFCDGSVHDDDKVKMEDQDKRECLERNGFIVLSWNYITPLEEFVESNKKIFYPVKT